MSATVIDALFVTLGLDPKGFKKGADEAAKIQTGLEKKVRDSGKRIEDDKKKQEKDEDKRRKEAEKRAKEVVQGIKTIRNEALKMFAVFAGGVGLVTFFKNTIVGAANMGRLSQNLRISTERLSAWQQAAERAGGSAEGIVSQLKESASEVARFKMGLAPSESLEWFFRMGGKVSDLKDGNSYLMARADIVKRLFDVDPTKAASVAQSMGITEDQFNLIKQGSAGIEKLLKEREKFSKYSAKDAEEADNLRKKMLDLRDSVEYSASKIAIALTPALTVLAGWLEKVADGIAKWVTEHRDDIARWTSEAADGIHSFITAVANFDWHAFFEDAKVAAEAFMDLAHGIKDAVDAWNGWLNRGNDKPTEGVSKGWFGLRFGKHDDLITDDIKNGHDPGSPDGRERFIYERAIKEGFTPAQAAGIVGSLKQENSSFDPSQANAKSGALGIAQWLSKDRKDAFKKKYGRSLEGSSFEDQVGFMFWELNNSEKRAGDLLRGAKTADEAAKIHASEYERPGAAEANISQRQSYARGVLGALSPSSSAPPVASNSSSETHIDTINIHTRATDAAGIAKDIRSQLSRYSLVPQANTGLA